MRKSAKTSGKKPVVTKTDFLGFSKELLWAAITVLLVNSFVLASFEVPTGSMEDTVKIGDRMFVNRFLYGGSTPYTVPLTSIRIPHFRVPGFRSVSRGDAIVFDWPGNRDDVEKPPQQWYLKRCIAIAGDTVKIENRDIYVNGTLLSNPTHVKYLRRSARSRNDFNGDLFPKGARFNEDFYGPIEVPKRGMRLALTPATFTGWEVFIRREGHNVSMAGDGIFLDGRKVNQYVVQRDYVFAMGDNRDNSLDSRFWGFVPVEDVIGTPIVIFWSWDPQIPIFDLWDKIRSVDLTRIGTLIH
jgi:signal peptidase I